MTFGLTLPLMKVANATSSCVCSHKYIVMLVNRRQLTFYRRKQDYTIEGMSTALENSTREEAERAKEEISLVAAAE